jgi:hypothetical protein
MKSGGFLYGIEAADVSSTLTKAFDNLPIVGSKYSEAM